MFDEYLDRIELAKRHASAMAYPGAFFAGLGVTLVFLLFTGGWETSVWIMGPLFVGCTLYGVVYGAAYILALNTYNQIPVQEVHVSTPVASTETLPKTAVSSEDDTIRLWQNGLLRTTGGNMVPIPRSVDTNHLKAILYAVKAGKLHDGLSPTKLDSEKVVSRNIEGPNAYTVVDFLASAGILRDNGERKMYTWTEAGRRVFAVPSPTRPFNPLDFSRVPEVTRPDSTHPTEYATNATG